VQLGGGLAEAEVVLRRPRQPPVQEPDASTKVVAVAARTRIVVAGFPRPRRPAY
jgi:hypothetical protein